MSKAFFEKIRTGKILVSDGATGTNLLQRGLPRGVSGENWVLEKPEEIVRLHRDFIDAGADIILTCTFSASPLRLEGSELAGRALEINHRAVELAHQAIGERSVLVGGSMGPAGKLLKPFGPLSEEEAVLSFAEQAQALSEAGVDLLVIETQFDLNEAKAILRGIRQVSSLPVVCSFSFDRGTRTMMGVKPAQIQAELKGLEAGDETIALGINCGRSLAENLAALKELRPTTDLPIWFKPNAGLPEVDAGGNAHYSTTPEQMGQLVSEWIAAGAQIVGGCCGTSPEHLRQIASAAHE
jgi:5-methyltetrahydrofolate--homocysteine methyltransferase